ncbi:sensor histidine kinase [Streptomyces sp. 8L]|uniref:sensor histidine kinase n=1 Tax=Streptomyces sp. 8L TaxID=2877242 RepID=UPI001CD47377|nr:sensor domain-containing protein [Streptomyces sp. 8L]MCA1222785.1 sensor domain-containing protein [Streptomyces sp. 8L]
MTGRDPRPDAVHRPATEPPPAPGRGVRAALVQRFRLLGWSLVLLLASVGAAGLLVLWSTAVGLVVIGAGLPAALVSTVLVRWFADRHRAWAGDVLGEPVVRSYVPLPEGNWRTRLWAILKDPATWRDWAWLAVNPVIGWFTAGGSFLIFLSGVFYAVYPLVFAVTPEQVFRTPLGPYSHLHSVAQSAVTIPFGLAILALWYVTAAPLARLNAVVIRSLLAPTEQARLRARVTELAASRAETVDTRASELRRIERDLHDGAQARLASLGMSLGLAEQLLAQDPEAAARLLSEARESTSAALVELRDLVRGIHPPVLADRGLDGAVQALALANPVPTEVTVRLPGRLPAPVESAAYFAVAEALANAVKHAAAHRVSILLEYTDEGGGLLRMLVGDDGGGGASLDGGTGLRGIGRRLGAFDGTLDVHSPVGGPTEVRMSLPCVLS